MGTNICAARKGLLIFSKKVHDILIRGTGSELYKQEKGTGRNPNPLSGNQEKMK